MIAVIFVRVGARHNGGETCHSVSVRRDPSMIIGEQTMLTQKKDPLRYNPCNINRKKRVKPAASKLPSTTGD